MTARLDSVAAMQQRYLGRTGLKVSRLGLGTLTWGRDTDEHEARDQLVAFTEAGGTLRRHRRRLRRRRLRGADRLADRRRRAARRRGPRHQGRDQPAAAASRETNASRGHLISTLDASLRRLGVDHVDLWQVHTWVDDTPLEETLSALDYAVVDRPGVVRRRLELHRLADRAGRDLAAGGARPGAAGVDPGRVLAAQPRRRGRGAPGRRGARPRRAALVAAGPRRAHRQVPHGTPADSRAASPHFASFVGSLPRRPRRARIVEAVARAADGLGWSPARGGAGLGARPARRHRARSSAPAPPPSCAAR